MQVLGYVRVSTQEQSASGGGLAAQRAAIEAEAERRGWDLVDTIEDRGYSARDLKRPGVQLALEALERGEAGALVVAKLDRLSRSMLDFAGLMDRAQRQSWALVALDCAVDTSTPGGEAMANVLATFAQFERRLIGERTRAAMQAKKAAGARFGRPRRVPDRVLARVGRERESGQTFQAIAEGLNADRVPTAHGGAKWWPATIQGVLEAEYAR
jgi:DNA invertase Pin-like site-specific DNA recombinase